MHLVKRHNNIYAYQSVRHDGRVSVEYRGSGELALLMAEEDAERRAAAQEEREALQAMVEADRELDRQLEGMAREAQDAARGELEANGYHQHARGRWRKRRGGP
jgi:hypothetical protein